MLEGGLGMSFARQHRFVILMILLSILMVIPSVVCAAEFNAKVTVEPDKISSVGETVTVNVSVENVSCDTEDPVTLFYSDGTPVEQFGEGGFALLQKGEKTDVSFPYTISQQQLNTGKIEFILKYTKVDDGEIENFEQKLSAPVSFNGTIVSLQVNRTITPEIVRKGNTAAVTYELVNNGTVDITNIKVQETIVKTAQTVKTLKSGQKTTLTFTARMGSEALTSSAVIQYKADNESGEQTVGEQIIPLASPDLTMTAACETDGVNIGESAAINIIFENKGNISYSNVTVSDERLGTLLSGLDVPANRTTTFTANVTLTEPTTFKIKADLHDNTGTNSSVNAATLKVNAYDPEKAVRLTLVLTTQDDTVTQVPATLPFKLVLTNDSNVVAKNIAITHGETSITSVSELQPGQSMTILRNIRISAAGSFRFTASCADSLGNSVSFDSNTLKITKVSAVVTAAPTPIPVPNQPTPVPAVSNLADLKSTYDILNRVLNGLAYAVLAVAALVFIALLVRLIKKLSSNAAYDHVDLSDRRDYTEPASGDPVRRQSEPAVMLTDVRNEKKDEPKVDLEDDSLTIGAASQKTDKPEETADIPDDKKLVIPHTSGHSLQPSMTSDPEPAQLILKNDRHAAKIVTRSGEDE